MEQRKSIYEKVNLITNTQTGEILREENEIVFTSDKEPDFIKLYLDCICTFKGLNKALSPILIGFCSYMTWADSEQERQLIWMNKITKEAVAKKLGIGVDRVNKALREIVNADIFRKIEGVRGCYEVNPYIIAKGKWKDIKKLRANFDFNEGTIEPLIEEIATTEEI